jgi:hypothetical protein
MALCKLGFIDHYGWKSAVPGNSCSNSSIPKVSNIFVHEAFVRYMEIYVYGPVKTRRFYYARKSELPNSFV